VDAQRAEAHVMGASIPFLGLLVFALAGCNTDRGPAPPGQPVPLKSFVLHDVQGLYGGNALWVAQDRTAIIQIVGPPPTRGSGLWEKRYRTEIAPEKWAEVERLVGAHHLLNAKSSERGGVPDEAHPLIVATPQIGAEVKVRKWANDENQDFDPVYRYLLGLCGEHGELVNEGAFDWDWRPDGFTAPWK
jgi:hypothetical protein